MPSNPIEIVRPVLRRASDTMGGGTSGACGFWGVYF
jgi:hypothetical protein